MEAICFEKAETFLLKLRQIRQISGELIAFLEHWMQLQTNSGKEEIKYNPDEYLERMFQFKNNYEKGESENGRT